MVDSSGPYVALFIQFTLAGLRWLALSFSIQHSLFCDTPLDYLVSHIGNGGLVKFCSVSYTHLDVYKRQLLLPAIFAFTGRKRAEPLLLIPMFVMFVLFIGLRDKVGMDWNNYLAIFDKVSGYTFAEAVTTSEPGFTVLTWLSFWMGFDVYGINFFGALIFSFGLFSICHVAREPWLALVVAIPYLVVVIAMSGCLLYTSRCV